MIAENQRSIVRRIAIGVSLCIALLTSGCATVNEQRADGLAQEGQQVATACTQVLFATDAEYRAALESEHFIHAYIGKESNAQILDNYAAARKEIVARKMVFQRLGEAYVALQKLSTNDAPTSIAPAISSFACAVESYSVTHDTQKNRLIFPDDLAGDIARLAMQAKKRQLIKQSSVLIRTSLERMLRLLQNPLVKEQLVGYSSTLAVTRSMAIRLLWHDGMLDPSPLITDLAKDISLQASAETAGLVRSNMKLNRGIERIINVRLNNKKEQIGQGYDASVRTIQSLIEEHRKLEAGDPFGPKQLQAIINELSVIAGHLSAEG